MAGPVCVFDGLEVGSEGDGGTEVRRTDLSLVAAAGLCGEVLWVTYSSLGWVTMAGLGDLPQGGDSALLGESREFPFCKEKQFYLVFLPNH